MSDMMHSQLPPGFERGTYQGQSIIGDITESLHGWLLSGWNPKDGPRPRIEEDLSFVPKDREKVIYTYMYRVARNDAMMNAKRWAQSTLERSDKVVKDKDLLYERPPVHLFLYYFVAVHAKFRSEAERLLGWSMLRLNDATHLLYRPMQYCLPSGQVVDSLGREWAPDAAPEEVRMERVSLALVDDLTIGDAINFLTIHEAPFRPFVTYRATCLLRGSMISGPGAVVRGQRASDMTPPAPTRADDTSPNGRIRPQPSVPRSGRSHSVGPRGFDHRPLESDDSESESED